MGPKKKDGDKMSTRTEKKLKEKVVQDKTFGLKNKNYPNRVKTPRTDCSDCSY